MSQITTSLLSGELLQYLDKRFLERSRAAIVHGEGAQLKSIPANSGKTITWNRYAPKAPATTPLSEGVNPTATTHTAAQVTATIAQYGDVEQITDLMYITSIDAEAKEKTDLAAQQMAETIDTLYRNILATASTVQFANGRSSLSSITGTDVLTSTEVRRVRRALRKANALPYADGFFLGKVGPDTSYDLMNDSVWVNLASYGDSDKVALYKGEIGKLFNIRFVEASSNQYNESSTVTVFSNFFHGQQAIGGVDLDKMPNGLIIKEGGEQDTSNPLSLYITVGWKAAFAAAMLNSAWSINVKCAASS